MRKKIFPSLLAGFCLALTFSTDLSGQNAAPTTETAPKTNPSPSPSASPKAPVPAAMSFMEQPDYKAMMAGVTAKDPKEKIRLFEKYLADYPNSAFISSGNQYLLDALVKSFPSEKDRIYQQALKTIATIKTDSPVAIPAFIASNINSVVSALYRAGMDDKAEEVALNGLKTIDNLLISQAFRSKYEMWTTLGQIYLKRDDLKKSEHYFKQALTGDYEGNTALLGLADIYEKKKKTKLQLEYLIKADAFGSIKRENRQKLEALYIKEKGSVNGLSEILDANYRKLNPLPFKVAKYTPGGKRTKRTVLAELFTGSACKPCITADVAFDGMLQRYNPQELAVLVYHLHIPGPDPMTNPATVARAQYYKSSSTPTYLLNGTDRNTGGGISRKESLPFYSKLTPRIDTELEKIQDADIALSATMNNEIVTANVNFNQLKDEYKDLKLNIALVEQEVSYTGENGIRIHQMVVRDLGGDKKDGFLLKDRSGNIEWKFDLKKVSDEIKAYLDKYETDRKKDDEDFAFSEKKYLLQSNNLAVVAFIQDEKSKYILQSAVVDLAQNRSK